MAVAEEVRETDSTPRGSGLLSEVLRSVLLGWGLLLVLSPFALYWFIHSSSERYLWLISGPAPFDSFGSGPFQLAMYLGLLLAGTVSIALAIFVRRNRSR